MNFFVTDELIGVSQIFLLNVTRPLRVVSGDEIMWIVVQLSKDHISISFHSFTTTEIRHKCMASILMHCSSIVAANLNHKPHTTMTENTIYIHTLYKLTCISYSWRYVFMNFIKQCTIYVNISISTTTAGVHLLPNITGL